VTLQIVRDWVVKFNARGPAGLIGGKASGQPSLLNDTQRAALAAAVENGPTPAVHGVVRWRLVDLCHWVWETFRISNLPTDDEPRASRDGLSQALRATAPSWRGRRSDRPF